MQSDSVEGVGMFRKYREYEAGEFIVVGADTSTGLGDYSAAVFLSKTKLDVPNVYHSKMLASEMTGVLHTELEKIYDQTGVKPVVAIERNNGGVFEMERLAHLNKSGKYTLYVMPTVGLKNNPAPKRYGWDTTSATRPKMLADLKEAIDNILIKIYDQPLINEMFSFIINQTSTTWKAEAERGAHDDLIISLAIAWQLYQSETPQDSQEYMPYELQDDLFDDKGFF